jgi:hypothetical protein
MPKDDTRADEFDTLLDSVDGYSAMENQVDQGPLVEEGGWVDENGPCSARLYELGGWYTWVLPEEQYGPYPSKITAYALSPDY